MLKTEDFQQEGALPHWAIGVPGYFDTKLLRRWIAREGPIAFLARSRDWTPLDFSMWSSVRKLFFSDQVQYLSLMKESAHAIAAVTTEN